MQIEPNIWQHKQREMRKIPLPQNAPLLVISGQNTFFTISASKKLSCLNNIIISITIAQSSGERGKANAREGRLNVMAGNGGSDASASIEFPTALARPNQLTHATFARCQGAKGLRGRQKWRHRNPQKKIEIPNNLIKLRKSEIQVQLEPRIGIRNVKPQDFKNI